MDMDLLSRLIGRADQPFISQVIVFGYESQLWLFETHIAAINGLSTTSSLIYGSVSLICPGHIYCIRSLHHLLLAQPR
jgi:hypothetical protein